MNRRIGAALGVALLSGLVSVALMSAPLNAAPGRGLGQADGVGAFDPDTATWHLRTRGGDPTVFVFGSTGSIPLIGDWDGDGIDTIGTYDADTATVKLRNTNSAGSADTTYSLGRPGDVPLAGDFDGDGVDSVSIYRPTDGLVRLYDSIGDGIGDPVATYTPAGSGGSLAVGDFDGDGIDTIVSRAANNGTVTNGAATGAAASQFVFASEGNRYFTGDWTGDGIDTPGVFDPLTATVHLRHTNTTGGPDESYRWGADSWIPVSGTFGPLSSAVMVNIAGAPQGLAWAVESLYLELDAAPYLEDASSGGITPMSVSGGLDVAGTAVTAEAYGGHVSAITTTDDDTILAVSDDGEMWRIVGGSLESQGLSNLGESDPRFVVLIGSDARAPADRLTSFADSIHIYGVNPEAKKGAFVGIPRDTAMTYNGPPGPNVIDGMAKISHTMLNLGPDVTTQTLEDETGLPIEGWFVTGFVGFTDLVDSMGGIDFLDIPYAVPSQCVSTPPPPNPDEGDSRVDGAGALAFSRERVCIPTEQLGSTAHTSNAVRTLAQGLLMKAAVEEVQQVGVLALPLLLDIMDEHVSTNLPREDVLTLAATLYGIDGIDPGDMPTLGPPDLDNLGYDAYNLNPGDLPNVVVEGCDGFMFTSSAAFFREGNYGTFADFADGSLDTLPVYQYFSGDSDRPYTCPWLLPPVITVTVDPLILLANTADGYAGELSGVVATETDGGPASLTNDAPGVLPFGDTLVTWTATGSKGLTTTATQTVRVVAAGDRFIDDDDSIFEADIEWMAAEGITAGCNPPANDRFCPDALVTREQMAAFLVRALGYTDDGGGDLFTDDDGSIFEGDIDRLGTAGVTKGCNPPLNTQFCPGANVTRGQMAAFLHRALG